MPQPHPDRPLILIADRDQTVRELQRHFLTAAGYGVEFADDGPSALEKAVSLAPVLMVVEILLKGIDGLALCRRLKDDPTTREIPILVFSILTAGSRAAEAGADAYLRKPLIESAFVGTIRELLASPSPIQKEQQWLSR